MNFNKIKFIAKEKKISIKDLAEKIGLTEVGLHQSLKNETLKITDLEKISGILEISITDFFDDNSTNDESVNQKSKYGNNYHSTDQGKIHNEGTVNGNVNITTAQLKDMDAEIVKQNVRIEMLTDKLLQKDKMIEELKVILDEKKAFLDQVIAGKERQIERITEEKEKQLKIREEEIVRIVEEKEKQIQLLNRMIEMLEKQIK